MFLKLTLHPFSSGGEVLRATDSAAHHEPCPYLMSRTTAAPPVCSGTGGGF